MRDRDDAFNFNGGKYNRPISIDKIANNATIIYFQWLREGEKVNFIQFILVLRSLYCVGLPFLLLYCIDRVEQAKYHTRIGRIQKSLWEMVDVV